MIFETGKVVSWIADRGFGFIAPDHGGNDVFVHATQLTGGMAYLERGDRVVYSVEVGAKGAEARTVAKE